MSRLRRLGAAVARSERTDPRRPRLRYVALIALGFLLAASGAAYAFFSANSSGTYGLAQAGQLAPPASFSASVISASTVELTWSAPTPAPPGSYSYVLTGTLGTGGTCSASMPEGATGCNVEGLTSTTHHSWTLAVKFHTWLSTPKPASATTKGAVPALCGIGGVTSWTGPATKPVAYPGCVQPTDLLVLVLARSHNNTAACPPSWTLRATGTVTAGKYHAFLEVCSRVYVSGDAVTMTVKGTAVRGSSAEVAAFEGVTTTTPFDTTPTSTQDFTSVSAKGAATFSAPGFTTTAAHDLALSVVMENDTTTTIPVLSLTAAPTTRGFDAQSSGGMQSTESDALDVATKPATAPGPVVFPTWTSTVTNATDVWIGESLALRPDPPSGSVSPAALLSAPSVAGISPSTGPVVGGTQVTVTGTGFAPTATVSFGTTLAAKVTVESATELVATSPAHGAGPVDVTVTEGTRTSATSSADLFTYVTSASSPSSSTAPTLTGVAPSSGSVTGGTIVTVTGTGFTTTTAVAFGTTAAARETVTGPTRLTVVAPPHAIGVVTLSVTTPSGTSDPSAADQFTYTSPSAPATPGSTAVGTR
ncbi:MAG: IPT/TIG domain-containing protein [Actinomycetota bacterium]|nr:IPT/TIG domain-containing protein [Actinomycetota bacterium]